MNALVSWYILAALTSHSHCHSLKSRGCRGHEKVLNSPDARHTEVKNANAPFRNSTNTRNCIFVSIALDMQLDGGTSSWKDLRIAVVCGDARSVQANLYERGGAIGLKFRLVRVLRPKLLVRLDCPGLHLPKYCQYIRAAV